MKENIEHNWSEMNRKRVTVSEALSWSITGRNLQKASKEFSASTAMKKMIEALADERGNSIDRFKMAQYFALSLEHDPEVNLKRFIEYLDLIAQKSSSQRRSEYYICVKNAVLRLKDSDELARYMTVYSEFKNDKTKESTLARQVMQEVTATTQKIMGEYA